MFKHGHSYIVYALIVSVTLLKFSLICTSVHLRHNEASHDRSIAFTSPSR